MAGTGKVAVFLTHKDDVQTTWLADATVAARRHGLQLVEHWGEQATIQSHQIGDWIWRNECDALVILATTHAGPTSLLREAVTHGRSVILLNRTSTDLDEGSPWSWPTLRRDHPKVLVATAVPDAQAAGRLQGQQFRALLPRGGTVLHVVGDPHSGDGAERQKGLESVVGHDPSFRLARVIGGYQAGLAAEACLRWLRMMAPNPRFQLDLVGSESEAMIPGIRRALDEGARELARPGLPGLPLTAIDGLPQYKREVDQGRLAATVEMPSRVAAAVDLLATFWKEGKRPARPIVTLPASSYPPLERLRGRAT
jgi:ABC-type sugar transport system substrate-binding protein